MSDTFKIVLGLLIRGLEDAERIGALELELATGRWRSATNIRSESRLATLYDQEVQRLQSAAPTEPLCGYYQWLAAIDTHNSVQQAVLSELHGRLSLCDEQAAHVPQPDMRRLSQLGVVEYLGDLVAYLRQQHNNVRELLRVAREEVATLYPSAA